ncbi:hypothetical protein MCEMZLE2_00050 [Candidatus Nanopelagicaceae bacterium]
MAITVFIVSGSVTDPVNVTKFLALGIVATASLSVVIFTSQKSLLKKNKVVLGISLVFSFAMILSAILSNSPFSQNIYGAYGRNNGLLTYIFLVALYLSATTLTQQSSFVWITYGLIFAGIVNILYCGWVLTFGDFVGWSNPYGNILGTLGNPNFIGAFLGIFSSFVFVQITISKESTPRLLFWSLLFALTWFEIVKSHAIQGRVVGALGLAIVLGYWIRSRYTNLVTGLFVAFSFIFGAFAVLGALQVGPLSQYIYKASVSLRGQYWLAGWNTGNSHPLAGVGMDSFGDWYRRMRDPHALEMPGVNTVVNAAHNVPLDIFAFGGWILFICYAFLVMATFVSIVRYSRRNREFDPVFVSLSAGWVGYQVQSIISINQIGLAIWGWLLGGSLIAYEKATRVQINSPSGTTNRISNQKSSNTVLALSPIAFVAGVVGLLVALPPFSADAKWRSAQLSRTAVQLEESLSISYFNPANTNKYMITVQIFEENQLFELSHKYALEGVSWNSESFELWKILYLIKNSTPEEKSLALANMKRLDPLNPDVTGVN